MTKKITILGSTGSVGLSTLEIVRLHPDRFRVVGLVAGENVELLSRQVREFNPLVVSLKSAEGAKRLKTLLGAHPVEILSGDGASCSVACLEEADMVVSAIVGAAGLMPTLEAIRKAKVVGLANKESMVIAGELMRREADRSGTKVLPIDSEHSALFQCLEGHRREDVRKLILTASGGPFLHKPLEEFASITVEEALKHPNWDMGDKITIDSATMMNKGLEVMEARWLFDLPVTQIEVCVHPQSVVHSMVEYVDGSVMAQLGVPDMRVPIAYAMSYPERIETGAATLDLFKTRELNFYAPDLIKFPCLKTAFEVARLEKTYPAVLNASNEVAVDAFLKGYVGFNAIHDVVSKTLDTHRAYEVRELGDILEADRWARETTHQSIEKAA